MPRSTRAGTVCSASSPRFSCGSRRAGSCAHPVADATCSRSLRASCNRSDSACVAASFASSSSDRAAEAWSGPSRRSSPRFSRAKADAVLNGNGAAPPNGALIITTDLKTSGRVNAHQPATGDPKSCPTTIVTLRWPSALISAIMSRTRLSVENGVRSSSNFTSAPPLRP